MSTESNTDAKIEKPATHFAEPHEVVTDSSLSLPEKATALDALEQDARQMAEASSEGMGGGERSKLRDVLNAKDAIAAPSVADAYEIVLRDLRLRQKRDSAMGPRTGLSQAIAVLDSLRVVPKRPAAPAAAR